MSSPALDLADNWDFTELWIDPTAAPPYVLILLCDDRESCCVYDPAQNYQVVFQGSYSESRLWLLEDEYERVEGQLRAEKVA